MAFRGVKVLELAGLAPSPFAGMVLSDFGAKVIRVDRCNPLNPDSLARGKKSIALDIRATKGQTIFKKMCKKADVLIEPFRPGVMERLNLGPETILKENPGIIYCRMSGYGQEGSNRNLAGHDINYIASSGVLDMLRIDGEKPFFPANLLADFAGGGLIAAFGIAAALFERSNSGKGQVLDINLTHGSAYASSFMFMYRHLFPNSPGCNMLDGGSPFYDTYKTKDGKYIAVGAIEPKFYAQFLKGLKLNVNDLPHQMDMDKWGDLRKIFTDSISQLSLEEIEQSYANSKADCCVTPVLSREEAAKLPHNVTSKTFFKDDSGKVVPNPAPKFSRTPATIKSTSQPQVGQNSREVLEESGFSKDEIDHFVSSGIVLCSKSKL